MSKNAGIATALSTNRTHRSARPRCALALLAALPACGTTRPGWIDEAFELEAGAPAALVAWLAADVGLSTFVGADPEPFRAGAPVWRHDDSWQVEFAGDHPTRVAMNGRLLPPRLLVADLDVRLEPPLFAPARAGEAGTGTHLFRVEVTAIPDRRCRVSVRARGGPIAGAALDHLRRALALAEDGRSGSLSGCCARHQLLRAPHLARSARLLAARSDDLAARAELARALACAPTSSALRCRLAALDERLARPGDAEQSWRLLGSRPGSGLAGRALRGRTSARQRDRTGTVTSGGDLGHARRLLAKDDLNAAREWRDRAGTAPSDIAAELLRARGDHRAAFAVELSALEQTRIDPHRIEALVDDALRVRDPVAGLRVVARRWLDLVAADQLTAHRLLDRCAAAAGPAATCRVLLGESRHELGPTALRAWRDAGDIGASALALLGRVPSLRSDLLAPTAAAPPRHDYEAAPGVAPPR